MTDDTFPPIPFSDELPESAFAADKAETDLIVPAGTIREIYPRTYKYRDIVVESGGTLRVAQRSRTWLIMMCERTFRLAGTLQYRRCFDSQTVIQKTAPDGTQLSHEFDAPMMGGRGGAGGTHNGVPGGTGGSPTRYNGGGGGGGAYFSHNSTHRGEDASGWQGGTILQDGGTGGRQSNFCHGGLIYLSVLGEFDGSGGTVDLRGLPGIAGTAGEPGRNHPGSYGWAGGGGAGGSPGGSGGVILIRAGEVVNADPTFQLHGGDGGAGGAGGAYNGRAGSPGSTGASGFVDYLDPL